MNRTGTDPDKRIRLLVCFIHAHIGGAMTSLVNFLNALDTEKYEVDVMFYENEPDERYGIKPEITILPQGKTHRTFSASNICKKVFSLPYLVAKVREIYYKKVKKNKRRAVQIMSRQGCKFSRRLESAYDVAIAYETNWCLNYVMTRVKAQKKILWYHGDFEKSGMDLRIDRKAYDKADALVFVSESVAERYAQLYPQHKDKTVFVPNLLSADFVRSRNNESVELPFPEPEKYVKLLTVARVRFDDKGFDRAALVFSQLKKDGLLEGVKWVIVGDGPNFDDLTVILHTFGLEDIIYLVGEKSNPIPYMAACDAFFLPSRHEGKPMAVTEAFIMGLPCVVAEYSSSFEQIRNGVDGIILENSKEGLYTGLRDLLSSPGVLKELRKNVESKDYGNEKDIRYFDKLIDGILA